jgi:NAD(P)-dependent dehydrogenase (short-subunit alcohol dehydrogenase family)
MGKLDGKIALITGASEGIGFSTAEHFLAEGVEHLFITGRRQDVLDDAVKKLGRPNVRAVQSDVSKMIDLDRLYRVIKEEKGRLDVLFANAGIAEFLPIDFVSEEHFDQLVNVNMKGVYFTVQKSLPLLSRGASIVLNGSVGSCLGEFGTSVYSATKAAVRSFARCWTTDLKDRQIRINVVNPGITETPMMFDNGKDQDKRLAFVAKVLSTIPMGRVAQPNEIAKTVVFLASNDSSYMTGSELFVDGGLAQV